MICSKGNALFLILIAVALFAALSYAVTQSGGGGGTIDKEQNLISASKITQYTSLIKTAVTRMVLTGTTVSNLQFGSAVGFSAILSSPCTSGEDCIFAPEGGGVSWIPSNSLSANSYIVSTVMTIQNLGTTANDPFFIVSPNSMNICEQINKGLGLSYSPVLSDSNIFDSILDAYPNKETACFNNGSGYPLYYHVLITQ